MSGNHRIRINQGRFIPLWLRLLISTLLFASMIYANLYLNKDLAIFLSIFLSTPVLPLWFSYQLLEIDPGARAYLPGYWVAGYKIGKWNSYDKIDDISIHEPGGPRILRTFSQRKPFEAYLVFSDSHRTYLIGNDSIDMLKSRVNDISEKLDLKHTKK